MGEDFNFYHMFETNFSERKNIWRSTKNIWGYLPLNASMSGGLGRTVARKYSIGDLHVCVGGLDILKIYF